MHRPMRPSMALNYCHYLCNQSSCVISNHHRLRLENVAIHKRIICYCDGGLSLKLSEYTLKRSDRPRKKNAHFDSGFLMGHNFKVMLNKELMIKQMHIGLYIPICPRLGSNVTLMSLRIYYENASQYLALNIRNIPISTFLQHGV